MVLPQGVAKGAGLRAALSTLRLSVYNATRISDAENDHDLLAACELGVAVEWGSSVLQEAADEVLPGKEGRRPRTTFDWVGWRPPDVLSA